MTAAEERGLAVHGWTVFLHADRLGALHPDVVPRNAFGDPYPTDLCPAHPEVLALRRDPRRRGGVPWRAPRWWPSRCTSTRGSTASTTSGPSCPSPSGARLLLGLCFCPSCRPRRAPVTWTARRSGHVPGGARARPGGHGRAGRLGGARSGRRPPLAAYLEARTETVSTLVAEVAGAVAVEGSALTLLDLSGALLGYATGEPAGPPAPSVAWRFGLDLRALAATGAGIDALAYAREPERVAEISRPTGRSWAPGPTSAWCSAR